MQKKRERTFVDVFFFVLRGYIFVIAIFPISYFLNTDEKKSLDCGAKIRIRYVVTCKEEAVSQVGMGVYAFVFFSTQAPTPLEPPFGRAAPSLVCICVRSWCLLLSIGAMVSRPSPPCLSIIKETHLTHAQQIRHPFLGGEFNGVQRETPASSCFRICASVLGSQSSRIPLFLPVFPPDPPGPH